MPHFPESKPRLKLWTEGQLGATVFASDVRILRHAPNLPREVAANDTAISFRSRNHRTGEYSVKVVTRNASHMHDFEDLSTVDATGTFMDGCTQHV